MAADLTPAVPVSPEPAGAAHPAPGVVRVLTLNLDSNRDTLAERLPATVAALGEADADVVAVQEVATFPDGTTAADALAAACGLHVAAQVEHPPHPRGGFVDAIAILSRRPALGSWVLDLPVSRWYTRRVVAAALETPAGRPLLVISSHLAWGGADELERLEEAAAVDAWVAELLVEVSALVPHAGAPVVVWCGDFNALPEAATLRFLTGLDPYRGRGAYWVDAWAKAGDGGPGITSTGRNPWAARTAAIVGNERPDLLPERRIDYVMVRGWAHGLPGTPTSARVVFEEPRQGAVVVPSDHAGLLVQLLDPPLPGCPQD